MTAASPVDVELAEQVAAFYADPLGFVKFAFPWGEPHTPLAEEPGPDPAGQGNRRRDTDVPKPWKQQQAADDGRGETGKTGKHGGMRVFVRE